MARPKKVHDGSLSIRASKTLIREARKAANAKGLGLAEYLRACMRKLIEE